MSGDEDVWTWTVLDDSGAPVDDAGLGWRTRFDAEAWLGERWRALASRGARRAVLARGDARVGPVVELRGFGDLPEI